MGIGKWLKHLLGWKAPKEMEQLPEVMGTITDRHGRRHPVYRGSSKYPSLSEEQVRRVARLREVLAEAYPMTLEGWMDGFLRDADPESEIEVIEACAAVYHRLASQSSLTSDEKRQLYGVLVAISAGVTDAKLASHVPRATGLPDLAGIAGMFREARRACARP